MTDVDNATFVCPTCNTSFARAEHLVRHEALHSGLRPHACSRCTKTFARKDGLLRHELTHDDVPTLLQQGRRACTACAQAKVKCCGSLPCLRCKRRNFQCRFPLQTPRQPDTVNKSGGSYRSVNRTSDYAGRGDDEGHSIGVIPAQLHTPSSHRSGEDNTTTTTTTTIEPGMNSLEGNPDSAFNTSNFLDQCLMYEQDGDNRYWRPDMVNSINWLPVEMFQEPMQVDLMESMDMANFARTRMDEATQQTTQSSERTNPIQQSPSFHSPSSTRTLAVQSLPEPAEAGDLYVDAQTTRRPKIPRKRINHILELSRADETLILDLTWPYDNSHTTPTISRYISDGMAAALHQRFIDLCIACAPCAAPFASAEFLSRWNMDVLVDHYFSYVHNTFPFLRQDCVQNLDVNNSDDLDLCLALQVLGAIFVNDNSIKGFRFSLFEFLHRALTISTSSRITTFANARRAQCLILLAVASGAFPLSRTWNIKLRAMSELRLFAQYLTHALLEKQRELCEGGNHELSIDNEEALRTVWFVWLLGLQSAKTERGGMVPLSLIVDLPLPCHEDIWKGLQSNEWPIEHDEYVQVTMQRYLQDLYIAKKLSIRIDDFTSTLLTYAVIHRTWEAEDSVKQPLSNIIPSAHRRSPAEFSSITTWPPSDPNFVKWRNSACDCFDVLHWRANAAIGMANGYEPVRVMHLHFARILIISPVADFIRVATSRTNRSLVSSRVESLRAIQRWASFDQYKARLAAIHAGVTQWHVRRFSVNAYCEPFAIAAATMTLWALSLFQPRATHLSGSDQNSGSESKPFDTILIDRPTDDELVQQFVRDGTNMKVVMTGVSNLWDADSPKRILQEGKRFVSMLGVWSGEARYYFSILEGLEAFDVDDYT